MLVIQDPSNEQTTHLLESLLNTFRSAEKIAGAFAFATATGVNLLTGDDAFQEVARRHEVDLIVGIDAITNLRALDSLDAVSKAHPNVSVRAFLNPTPGATFHPKMCWTKNKNGGHLVVGSGNLTGAGLWSNWEAYSVHELDAAGIGSVEATWNQWTARHQDSLLPLDNAEVRKWASENKTALAREGDLPTLIAPGVPPKKVSVKVPVVADKIIPSTAEVLIAEIPDGGNRWQQVNFHKEDYEGFFGAEPGKLFLFRYIEQDGSLADYERSRPGVVVKSHNYRFELGAGPKVPYPNLSNGRPIGVYLRVAPRTFFYRLVLPDDSQYQEVRALLPLGRPNKMRTIRMPATTLRSQWTDAPFWKITSED